MQEMQDRIRIRQRSLKSLCATVRNEYSKACLQGDFRAGLKELCRKPDDDEGAQEENNAPDIPLAKDFEMDVIWFNLGIELIRNPKDPKQTLIQ